jgi:TPR repeat protein
MAVPKKDGNGQAELTLARRYLRHAHRSKQRVAAIKLLWSATKKGNTEAELQLAGIYIRGRYVPRNCEQARILLRAAHNGSDAAVAPDLQKLLDNDCK